MEGEHAGAGLRSLLGSPVTEHRRPATRVRRRGLDAPRRSTWTTALLALLLLPGTALAGDGVFGDWKSVDWVSVGYAIPAPQERCDEEDNQPPCYRFETVAAVGRLELGRFRYGGFQLNIGSVFGGNDWTGKEHIGMGFLGLGYYAPISDGSPDEVGVVTQPLSGVFGPSYGLLNTNLYYRYNLDRFFLELGVEFSPVWNLGMSSDDAHPMTLGKLPIRLHLSLGFQTYRAAKSDPPPAPSEPDSDGRSRVDPATP